MVDGRDLRNLFGMHLTLPMIYADADAVHAARTDFASGLEALAGELPDALRGLSADQVLDGLRWTNFFLAYQGEDDRTPAGGLRGARRARGRYRRHRTGAPRSQRARPAAGAFASASRRRFFTSALAAAIFSSWVTDLDRDRFEVFAYHLFPGMDDGGAGDQGARGLLSQLRRHPRPALDRRPGDSRRRARRARLSRARHGRVLLRLGRTAPRAAAVRRLGPPGDHRSHDDRRVHQLRRDGAGAGTGTTPST